MRAAGAEWLKVIWSRSVKSSFLEVRAEVIFARVQKLLHNFSGDEILYPGWRSVPASRPLRSAGKVVLYDQLWIISYQSSHEDFAEGPGLGTLRIGAPISRAYVLLSGTCRCVRVDMPCRVDGVKHRRVLSPPRRAPLLSYPAFPVPENIFI